MASAQGHGQGTTADLGLRAPASRFVATPPATPSPSHLTAAESSSTSGAPDDLDPLGTSIRAEWDAAHVAHGYAILHYLRIGHSLAAARSRYRADRAYGKWFRDQGFKFSMEWGRQIRHAARHEDEVCEWWHQELEAGRNPSLRRYLASLAPKPSDPKTPTVATPVATNRYPQSERRAWLEEPLAPHLGRGERVTKCANDLEQSLRAWEDQQTPALHDVLSDRLSERDPGEIDNLLAEFLAVLRGE
jgi:hypothetical protein